MALFPITQGIGVSVELFGYPIGAVAERRGDYGVLDDEWQFGASFHDVNVDADGVNLELGVGAFIGGDVSVPIVSPAC